MLVDNSVSTLTATGENVPLAEWKLACRLLEECVAAETSDVSELLPALKYVHTVDFGDAFFRFFEFWNQNALFQFVQSGERSVARIAVKKRLHLTLIEVVTRTLCILPNHKVRLKNQTSAIVDMCWNDTMSAELEADILSKLRGDNQKIHHPIFESIAYLEWADKLQVRLLAALDRMLADHLESFVNNFESPCLPTILSWFQLNVLPKTSSILGDELSAEFLSKAIDTVNIAFCKMRIKSSFDMIVEYPSSEPAFDELTGIFNFGSTMRSDFSRHLMSEIKRRLLRPAAKTGDIIHFYISTISALTKLDNHGHLVHFVTEPICNYLRTRDDTVRCIIHSLFDDPDLEADLKRPDLITINEDLTDDEWEPAPMDLPLTKFHKNSDILSALVNIYDSKDVFVKEFQLFLSTRLLNVKNFDYQDEFGYVELLKIRFGDCLHASEVMLRDMLESSRLDQTIKSSTKDQSVVHAIIVSHLFWPTLKTSPIAYPANMARYLEAFEKEYQKVKRSRNLKWIPELGSVDLEITTGDGNTIAVTVSPLHAAVVSLFENDTQLEFNEMAKKLKMSAEAVISKVAYWINLGVLTKDGNVVRRGGRKNSRGGSVEDEHEETAEIQEKDANMQVYWTYINGMLSNLGALPFMRIHMMLSMFVQAPNKYDCSPEQLQAFLDSMVRDDRLDFAGGTYKLK